MEPLVKCPVCDTRLVDDEEGLHCPDCGWDPSQSAEYAAALNGAEVECGHTTYG